MNRIVVESLVKKFGDVRAVDGVDLELREGEFLTLLGPSGCGKTTILRCVAGLEHPDQGRITIGQKLVTSARERILLPPEKRDVGMVFQSYAIWPHMKVYDNVAFGLSIRGASAEEIKEKVHAGLKLVQMEEYASRYATELSGGQQQRVAIARALTFNPRALLFDEPLSNLDAKLREEMRIELVKIQKTIGISTLYVTHDQVEAMAISDRIVVMEKGKIIQAGTPEEIYNHPANTFVAGFIGTTNLIRGRVASAPGNGRGEGSIEFQGEGGTIRIGCFFGKEPLHDGEIVLSLRQEHIRLSASLPEEGENVFRGKVTHRAFLGDCLGYQVRTGDLILKVKADTHTPVGIGDDVFLRIAPGDVVVLPPE
jgi:iron(III) transport system ATP-binding protein